MTSIEWTEETWNPTTGCDRISPGCGLPLPGHEGEPHSECYALVMAKRLKLMGQAKYQNDGDPRTSGPGFGLTLHPDVLDVPLRRRKPTTYFVNSMSDLFHQDVPPEFIGSVWRTMALTPQHTYQILTKRPQRMAEVIRLWAANSVGSAYGGPMWRDHKMRWNESPDWPFPNVWLGTSIESDRYTFRADHLRNTPAAVRFLSLEPLLGPLPSLDLTGIDWCIVGAESGRGARAMDLGWVRDIRDRCTDAGVKLFFKQDAERGKKIPTPELDGERWVEMPTRKAVAS